LAYLGHEEFLKGNDLLGLRGIAIKPLKSLIKTLSRKEQEGEEILCFLLLLDEI
jgi:hypothetical protein